MRDYNGIHLERKDCLESKDRFGYVDHFDYCR